MKSSSSTVSTSLFIIFSESFRTVCVCQWIWQIHRFITCGSYLPKLIQTWRCGICEILLVVFVDKETSEGDLYTFSEIAKQYAFADFACYFNSDHFDWFVGKWLISKVSVTTRMLICCFNSLTGISPQIWFLSGATGKILNYLSNILLIKLLKNIVVLLCSLSLGKVIHFHKMCSFCAVLDKLNFGTGETVDVVVSCFPHTTLLLHVKICAVFRNHWGIQKKMWTM